MNDIERRNNIPSTKSLSKLGIAAVGYTAAGVFLLVLNILIKIPLLGYAVGGAVCLLGIASFTSKDPADKRAGTIILAAGVLSILSKIGVGPSGALLAIGTIGLFALGIWNGIKFLIGLKKRS